MQVAHRHFRAMGTRFDLVLPGMEDREADHILKLVRSLVEGQEQLLSIHRSDSELAILNRTAMHGKTRVSPRLLAILEDMDHWYRQTSGYFDPAAREGEGPGMKAVELEEGQVRFHNSAIRIDPGGYGKGLAVEEIVRELSSLCSSALLSFGGSLVYGLGSHPHGESWPIRPALDQPGIDPLFELRDQALSTSGNSLNNQKKFAISGHILNPHTGRYCRQMELVSVQTDSPLSAEVLSTALFAAGSEKETGILANFPGLRYERYANKD